MNTPVNNTRYRPIKGGIPISRVIGSRQLEYGTLGCLAVDKADNAPVLLCNWHVLYGISGADGEAIYQPGPIWNQWGAVADDTNKIAVNRRGLQPTANVDAAIAAIDVSSCCHCCGIHYCNEIDGLSISGRPPLNTIVDRARAVKGETVFKVGQATGRTEGTIIATNHSFTFATGGKIYSFTDQIAIQHIDPSQPFSGEGDSGAVLVNLENRIVGLIFACGRNVVVDDQIRPFVSIANHIDDVIELLEIRILYSPNVICTSGERLAYVPSVREAPIPEPYRVLRERLLCHENTARLFALGEQHAEEIAGLINHCRPVTIAWHRCGGPALLAAVMAAVREGHYRLPEVVKGVAPHEAVERMRVVLSQYGSPALKELCARPEAPRFIEALKDCADIHEMIARAAVDERLRSALHEAGI